MPQVRVKISYALRRYTGGAAEAVVEAETAAEALTAVAQRFPSLGERVWGAGGEVQDHIAIFVNGDDIRQADGLRTPVGAGDRVELFPPAAGGMAPAAGSDPDKTLPSGGADGIIRAW